MDCSDKPRLSFNLRSCVMYSVLSKITSTLYVLSFNHEQFVASTEASYSYMMDAASSIVLEFGL